MKKTPAHKKTIKDLVPQLDGIPGEGASAPLEDLTQVRFDENLDKSIKEYNKNITKLDSRFTSLIPMNKILVRVFLKELKKNESGLYIPQVEFVRSKTHAGVGYIGEVESPFPYSKQAVVVSVPDNNATSLVPGDIVLLNSKPVKAEPSGSGNEARIIIASAFTHPDLGDEVPTNPADDNYGYLLIQSFDIDFKLK